MLSKTVFDLFSSVGSMMSPVRLNSGIQHACPSLPKGDLVYNLYMGYPEIFQWDKKRCVAYVRCVLPQPYALNTLRTYPPTAKYKNSDPTLPTT